MEVLDPDVRNLIQVVKNQSSEIEESLMTITKLSTKDGSCREYIPLMEQNKDILIAMRKNLAKKKDFARLDQSRQNVKRIEDAIKNLTETKYLIPELKDIRLPGLPADIDKAPSPGGRPVTPRRLSPCNMPKIPKHKL